MNKINCNLCSEVGGVPPRELGEDYERLVRTKGNRIAETANFIIVPSVGPLNESHAMIVPKRHYLSFAECGSLEAEYEALITELADYSMRVFHRKMIFFESGTGRFSGMGGGCIVHAHIHCVFESTGFAHRLMQEVQLSPMSQDSLLAVADTDHGYVWFRDGDRKSYICNRPLLPSQFLRYIYAEGEARPLAWNWRKHSDIVGVANVLDHYAQFVASRSG